MMNKATKCIIVWCAVIAPLLALTPSGSQAASGTDFTMPDAGSLGMVSTEIADWARQSSHHSLDMLGIDEILCDCLFMFTDDEQSWLFNVEPEIQGIDRGGPSDGLLEDGDVIVAIDGMLVTTRRAGTRLANLEAGEPVELEVRRGRRTQTVTVVPRNSPAPSVPMGFTVRYSDRSKTMTIEPGEAMSSQLARSINGLTLRARELGAAMGSLGLSAYPGSFSFPEFNIDFGNMFPQGWVGFGLSFSGSIKHKDEGKSAEWRFNEPPLIKSVQPDSPADKAGLQVNDVLLEIDGLELDSRKGGQHFSCMAPGQTVEWKVRRGGKTFSVETTAAERPVHEGVLSADASTDTDTALPLRYTGALNDTQIEVRSAKDVQVDQDPATGEIVIRSGESVVRLKPKGE